MSYTIGSLFSGVGGLELGLERAGLGPVVWQAESEPFCRSVLAKHWPGVKCYEDVRQITAAAERPGLICGGFPCQDISNAGKQAGIEGEKSGLWAEFARIVGELQPRIVVVENVTALLGRGMGRVLRDLSALGYDAVWDCVPAASVGAPHRRDRVFIVAHSYGHSKHAGAMADTSGQRLEAQRGAGGTAAGLAESSGDRWWETEPDVGRVADGVRNRSHRLRALGNAVVPQVAEVIGRAIVEGLS